MVSEINVVRDVRNTSHRMYSESSQLSHPLESRDMPIEMILKLPEAGNRAEQCRSLLG